jgi:hypothetical protein
MNADDADQICVIRVHLRLNLEGYFFSLMQKSVFCPRRYISPEAITGVAMKI